jgi:hypothetical protein
LGSSITGVVIEDNTLIDCGLSGEGDIDIKPAAAGAVIRRNTHYRTTGGGSASGVVVASNSTEIYRNRFYNLEETGGDWGHGIYVNADGDGTTGQAISSVKIYNNLIYSNNRAGINLKATKATAGANLTGVYLWNNTVVGNGTSGLYASTANGKTVTLAEMHNNIFSSNSNYEIEIGDAGVSISAANYNSYYRSSGNSWKYQGVEKTWAQWQGLGFDANGLNADPDLVATVGDDLYKLQVGSNCIDAGDDLSGSGFSDDYWGTSRPVGAFWDIGAYEGEGIAPEATTNTRVSNVTSSMLVTDKTLFGLMLGLMIAMILWVAWLAWTVYRLRRKVILHEARLRFFEQDGIAEAWNDLHGYLKEE